MAGIETRWNGLIILHFTMTRDLTLTIVLYLFLTLLLKFI